MCDKPQAKLTAP